jgi:hypothetical protein
VGVYCITDLLYRDRSAWGSLGVAAPETKSLTLTNSSRDHQPQRPPASDGPNIHETNGPR